MEPSLMTSFWEGILRLAGKFSLVKLHIGTNDNSVGENTRRVWRRQVGRQFTLILCPWRLPSQIPAWWCLIQRNDAHSGRSMKNVQCPLHYGRSFLLMKGLNYKNGKLPKVWRFKEDKRKTNSIHFMPNKDKGPKIKQTLKGRNKKHPLYINISLHQYHDSV